MPPAPATVTAPAALGARPSLLAGMRAIAPILLGVLPFALISGVVMVAAGLTQGEAVAMSVLVFAGAAQLAAAQLFATGAALPVILLTALFINLRFLMYSAAIAPHLSHLPARWKAPLAYLLTDQNFAVSAVRFTQADAPRVRRPWFFLGAALTQWLVWQLGALLGIFLGTQIPASWGLDFAIPLTFMALLVPAVADRAALWAAIAATGTALLAFRLPFNGGLILAALVGIAVGLLAERGQA